MAGPDRLGFISLEQNKAAAARQVLAKFEDTNISDADLSAWLSTFDASKVPTDLVTGLQDPAQVYQASLASAALRGIQERGRTAIAQWIREVTARQPVLRHVN